MQYNTFGSIKYTYVDILNGKVTAYLYHINDNVNLDFKATFKNKTTVSKTPEKR